MLRHIFALSLATTAAAAQTVPDYIDDRSSARQVVASLYNAVNRHEYLRAWSYFRPETAPESKAFRDGYADTQAVEVKMGEVLTEGAAGSIHSMVPVALHATATDGAETVFTGCYYLTQVQPGNQEVPPFRPIQIDRGELAKSDQAFEEAMGVCE